MYLSMMASPIGTPTIVSPDVETCFVPRSFVTDSKEFLPSLVVIRMLCASYTRFGLC